MMEEAGCAIREQQHQQHSWSMSWCVLDSYLDTYVRVPQQVIRSKPNCTRRRGAQRQVPGSSTPHEDSYACRGCRPSTAPKVPPAHMKPMNARSSASSAAENLLRKGASVASSIAR